MIFTVFGYIFVALIIFVVGCVRGEQMTHERAEKLVDSGKPFIKMCDGRNVYLQTAMHTTSEQPTSTARS